MFQAFDTRRRIRRFYENETPILPTASHKASLDMAEQAGAQAPPTFKLVLVGDGGTGKVRLEP